MLQLYGGKDYSSSGSKFLALLSVMDVESCKSQRVYLVHGTLERGLPQDCLGR